jgi:crotonobetainyl-CoA:carnitine CoA-transferase CaiB-like acyl-CoA transferase
VTEFQQPRLRVVELSQGVGGAVCGRLLAGLGHDVVKCEPVDGDFTRRLVSTAGDVPEAASPLFAELNAGKRGIVRRDGTIDELLMSRIAEADVVIVDGNPAEHALSAAQLHSRFPQLVIIGVTTAGLDYAASGPDLGEGDSLLAEAAGGMAYMIGEPDGRPLALGGEQASYAAGMVAFFGAMLALRRRDRLGAGELVDVALTDVVAYLDWKSDVRHHEAGDVPKRSGGSSGRWRMVPARDGWVGVIFEPTQWQSLVELVGDPRLADPQLADDRVRNTAPELWWPAIEQWAAVLPKAEIYERAQSRGLPFGHAVTVAEIPHVAQYRARGFSDGAPADGSVVGAPFGPGLPWYSHRAPQLGQHQAELQQLWMAPPIKPGHPGASGAEDPRPLAGVTVVDLGTITAGAATSRLLADYGATVIKVESPDRPDAFRKWIVDSEAPTDDPTAIAPMFDSNNAGKLGLAVDLKTPDGLAALKRVIEGADVLVENFGIGVTERLGIDFRTLHKLNPRLVYVSLSSQGQQGPECTSRSYGSTLDLLSGLASVTGYDAGHPLWSSVAVNYPDQLASIFGASMAAYCLALGLPGVHLDLSQREVVSWTLAADIRSARESGELPVPTGNARPGRTPHDVYRCHRDDSWVAISCRTDEHRDRLAQLVSPLLAGHSEPWWLSNARLVDETITQWSGERSADECVKELTAAGVPSGSVATAQTRAADPHFGSRRVFLESDDRRIKGFPMVMQGFAPAVPQLAPRIGEHTGLLLNSILATSDES